ncbi:bacteriophage protein gp37 [Mycobacteroides abscessus subsp. massiliense]|nr:bacteriophage protein gp37 [Mycobacteroides abscessus subsp. massiliense]
MGDRTGIEWTDATWNPVTGCDKVSPGCDHCYAETFAERWRGTPGHYFESGFDVQLRPDKLDLPLRWTKPRKVFVNSMSDLFHDKVPDEYIARVFAVMALAPRHTFQLLTKRHGRMHALLGSERFPGLVYMAINALLEHGNPLHINDVAIMAALDGFSRGRFMVLPNVWLGVSAEDQKRADLRIPALLDTSAAVRFVSAEPLLGPLDIARFTEQDDAKYDVPPLSWVIVGGESGPGARPMHPEWARSLRDQCVAAGVPFLFKQWGEWTPNTGHQYRDWANLSDPHAFVMRVGKRRAGRELDGRTWDQYPGAVA